MEIELEEVPCKWCEEPTAMTGTGLCDNCYEVTHRLDNMLVKKKDLVILICKSYLALANNGGE